MVNLGDTVAVNFGKREGQRATVVDTGRSSNRWKLKFSDGTTVEYPDNKFDVVKRKMSSAKNRRTADKEASEAARVAREMRELMEKTKLGESRGKSKAFTAARIKKKGKAPPPPPGKGSKPKPRRPGGASKPKVSRRKSEEDDSGAREWAQQRERDTVEELRRADELRRRKEEKAQRDQEKMIREQENRRAREEEAKLSEEKAARRRRSLKRKENEALARIEDMRAAFEREKEDLRRELERDLRIKREDFDRKMDRELRQHKRSLEEKERELRFRLEEDREKAEDKIRALEDEAKDIESEARRKKRAIEKERAEIEEERKRLQEKRDALEAESDRLRESSESAADEVAARLRKELEEVRNEAERNRKRAERERQRALEIESMQNISKKDDRKLENLNREVERLRLQLRQQERRNAIRETAKSNERVRRAASMKMVAPVRAKDLNRLDALVAIMNNLHDASSRLGEHKDELNLSLPRIAVIGGQSAGKSSVLEALVGRGFLPRGNGIVTRRPLVLQMVCDKSCKRERAQFSHTGNRVFYDFAEVQREIVRETERLTGGEGSVNISDQPILLKVTSSDVLNLTLVDLPGMTRVPIRGQARDMPKQLREMALKFIKDPNTIILAVSAANQDLAVSDAIQLAKRVDPNGERTVGVLTKLDLMDAGTDASDILKGVGPLPLKLGYIGVVNRSQADLQSNMSVDRQRQNELDFFRRHRKYRVMAEKQGTGYLATVLNRLLLRGVEEQLPTLKRQVDAFIARSKEELEGVKAVPTDAKSRRLVVTRILQQYAANIRNSIRYNSRMGGERPDEAYTGGLQHGAMLRQEIEEYAKNLATVDIGDLASPAELSKVVGNTVGTGLFSPNDAFYSLVRRGVERMRKPSQDLIVKAQTKLLQLVKRGSSTEQMGRFPTLGVHITRIASSLLESCLKQTRDSVNDIVDMELALINTEHPDFAGSRRKLGRIIAKISNDVMEESLAKRRRMMIGVDGSDEDFDDGAATSSYASMSGMSSARAQRRAVVSKIAEDGGDGDEDDDDDSPPPIPTRRGSRDKPPPPPSRGKKSAPSKLSVSAQIKKRVLFSGVLERKSKGIFTGWKQQWVQLSGDRYLRYWNSSEVPPESEPPYRELDLKGAKLELGDCYTLRNKAWEKNDVYEFRNVSSGSAGTYSVIAPFGVGWRKAASYDDRFEDGVRGPDAGAIILASKTREVVDKKSGATIVFVYVSDKDSPSSEHGGWLPVSTRNGEAVLKRQVQDVEKYLELLTSDKKYAAWFAEQKRALKKVSVKVPKEEAPASAPELKSSKRRRRVQKRRSLFEVEEIEKRMLRTLILSYYQVVQKKVTDSVPKIVTMNMIASLCEKIEKELYIGILSKDVRKLMSDGDRFAERRDRILDSLTVLEKVKTAMAGVENAASSILK